MKKMNKKFKNILWFVFALFLTYPSLVGADKNVNTGKPNILNNPLGNVKTFDVLVGEVAKIVGQLGITVAAIFIIWSGFLYVSARGSEEKLKKAHQTFTWAIVGTAVILGAWVIATAVSTTVQSLGK